MKDMPSQFRQRFIVYFLNRKPIAVPAKSQKGILPLSK